MTWNFQTWSRARAEADRKVQDSYLFLSTGKPIPDCYSSSQCGSGWACIGGKCVFQATPGSESTCDTGPTGGGGCSTGAPSGCTTSNCGASGTEEECCGSRCCRYSAGGGGTIFVQCFCGDCPKYNGERCSSDSQCASGSCIAGYCGEDGRCTAFCDGYYKSTGKLFPGCSQENVCDECSYCDENSPGDSSCARSETGPCWCTGCDPGYQCNKDGNCSPIRFWACRDFTKCGSPTGDKCCSDNPAWLYKATTCRDRLLDEPCDEEDKGFGENPCDEYCQDKQSSGFPPPEVTAEGTIDPNGVNTFYELWTAAVYTAQFYGGCINTSFSYWTNFKIPISGSYTVNGTGNVNYSPQDTTTSQCSPYPSGPNYIQRTYTDTNGNTVTNQIEGPKNFYSQFAPTPITSWSVRQIWSAQNPANALPASEVLNLNTVGQGDENWQPPCSPGCQCTKQGFISAAGETIYFYKECCYQNAPPELNCEQKDCDCVKNPETCDQECGECRICDRETNKCVQQSGTCPADPTQYGFVGFTTGNKYGSLTLYDLDSCYFGPAQPDGIASFRATRLADNEGVCISSSGNQSYVVGNTYNLGGLMASFAVTLSDTVRRINGNSACGNPTGYLVRVELG